jgi:hypothetical protein
MLGIDVRQIGTTGGKELKLEGSLTISVDDLRKAP